MVAVDESSVIIAVAGMILEVFQWGKLLHCHDIELCQELKQFLASQGLSSV